MVIVGNSALVLLSLTSLSPVLCLVCGRVSVNMMNAVAMDRMQLDSQTLRLYDLLTFSLAS